METDNEIEPLYLLPHEYRRWYCPVCGLPSVTLTFNFRAFCGWEVTHLNKLTARIEGKELVVVSLEADLRLKEHFDPEWNPTKRIIKWAKGKFNV
jgi:hypothetical protein